VSGDRSLYFGKKEVSKEEEDRFTGLGREFPREVAREKHRADIAFLKARKSRTYWAGEVIFTKNRQESFWPSGQWLRGETRNIEEEQLFIETKKAILRGESVVRLETFFWVREARLWKQRPASKARS